MSPSITIDRARIRNPESARSFEWLVTNGRGGFAMGSVANILTRRYHGLLVAAVKPPIDRWVLLAKLEPAVTTPAGRFELATNDYPAAVHPMGFEFLDSFTPSPVPTWRWRLPDGTHVEQSLFMAPGQDATFIQYRLLDGPDEVAIELNPLCTSRFMHDLAERFTLGEPELIARPAGFTLRWHANRPTMHLDSNGSFQALPDWYYQFVLTAESQRGLDDRQDLFMPGPIRATLHRDRPEGLIVVASTEPAAWSDWTARRRVAVQSRTAVPLPDGVDDPLARRLARATADFIVDRDGGLRTVVAGYPWFGDWGRDTFISLPGLCLVTGRLDTARQIIDTFSRYVRDGLVPNLFPDAGEEPAYNTGDASLWFIHAIDRYVAYSGDWAFVADQVFPAIAAILEAHESGTRFGIRADADGLLACGEPGVQLTWMDARVDDWVVTPRIGKPVEINALWYNALRIAADFAERLGHRAVAARWSDRAARARQSFNRRFWNQSLECCFDVIDDQHVPGRCDPSIRPNQIFSISLTHPILDSARWPAVVRIVREKLWTPLGLRTLDPAHPDYQSRYGGDRRQRDGAYHQGTVWPWLLGPFVTASIRAGGNNAAARRAARELLAGLEPHLADAGLDSVSEVADADPPHRPGGCPWQAWSVAEPLRALVEDIAAQAPAPPPTARCKDEKSPAAVAG